MESSIFPRETLFSSCNFCKLILYLSLSFLPCTRVHDAMQVKNNIFANILKCCYFDHMNAKIIDKIRETKIDKTLMSFSLPTVIVESFREKCKQGGVSQAKVVAELLKGFNQGS